MNAKRLINVAIWATVALLLIILIMVRFWGWSHALLMLRITVGAVVAISVAWLIPSFRIVNANETAMRSWFGWLGFEVPKADTERRNRQWFGWFDKKILKPGFHFVPWFPFISLERCPAEVFEVEFRKADGKDGNVMSGTMMEFRSKAVKEKPATDTQEAVPGTAATKMFVEGTATVELPYANPDAFGLMVKHEVPREKKGLAEWIRAPVVKQLGMILGKEDYRDVYGNQANEDINEKMQDGLEDDKSIFRRYGLIGDEPGLSIPGDGVFSFQVEYIHVPGVTDVLKEQEMAQQRIQVAKLKARADQEVAKVEKETAKSVAKREAVFIDGPVEIALRRWVRARTKDMGLDPKNVDDRKKARDALEADGSYAWKQKDLTETRRQLMAPNADYDIVKHEFNIHSAGQPVDPNFAAIVGGAQALGSAFSSAKGDGGGKGQKQPKKPKQIGNGGGQNPPSGGPGANPPPNP